MRYRGKRCVYEGITFASQLERDAYIYLKTRYANIQLQPPFVVQEGFFYDKMRVLPIKYVADFQIGNLVLDAKPTNRKTNAPIMTTEARLKIKMFKYRYKDSGLIFKLLYKTVDGWVIE